MRFRRLLPYLRRHRKALAIGAVSIVAGDLLLLSVPWWLRKAIDAMRAGQIDVAQDAALTMLVVTVFGSFFKFVMRRWMIGASRWIELEIRRDFAAHLFTLSPTWYDRHKVGDLMALATNDLNAIRMLLGPGIMYVANTSVTLTVALILMLSLSPKLTLFALLPLPVLALAVQQGSRFTYSRFTKVQEQFGTVNSFAQEALTGVRTVKAFAREERLAERFDEAATRYVDLNVSFLRVQAALYPSMTMLAGFTSAAVLYFGGRMVIAESISVGTLVAFLAYSVQLTWPTIALGWTVNLWQRGLASLDRLGKILDATGEITEPENPVPWPREQRRGEVVVEDLSFSYPESEIPSLEEVSLRCAPGTWTAIVGPTGSGKTTLLRMIARQYDEYEGTVAIDGIDLREMSLADLRAGTGYTPQDGYLFSDTLRENIAFAQPGLTDEDLEELARVSRLERDRDNFPQGWQTPVGERGVTLSGGQKQRVGIARALATKPKLLLLDDVFSSIDTETEAELTAQLKAAWVDTTVLLVTHRLLSLGDADWIVVLDEGRVVEQGRHADLMRQGGLYQTLYAEQQTEEKIDSIDAPAGGEE